MRVRFESCGLTVVAFISSEPLMKLRGVLSGGPIEVAPARGPDGGVQSGGHAD